MDPQTRKSLEKLREDSIARHEDLEHRISLLEKKRDDLAEEIEAINVLLKDEIDIQTLLPTEEPKTLAGMGFREAVRHIMRSLEKPVTVKEIQKNLLDSNYEYKGETPLPIRIGNDLNRMKHQGTVTRQGHRWTLTAKGWEK